MRGKTCSAAIGAALVLLLSGCAQAGEPVEEPVEVEVLSATKAGGLYLDAVCPVNEAWGEADVEIDRLRIAQARGETDTEAFAEAMRAVGKASEAAAKQLEPKDRAWPEDATDEIEAVRETLRADAKQADKVAEMKLSEVLAYTWKDSAEIGTTAEAARTALGLPADPIAACSQWAEQRAEEEAEKEAEKKAAEEKSEEKSEEDTKTSSGTDSGETDSDAKDSGEKTSSGKDAGDRDAGEKQAD